MSYFSEQLATNDDWFSAEITELMLVKDNMDAYAYEIKENFRTELLQQTFAKQAGGKQRLTQITGFEMESEEYTPALNDENALCATMCFHVDAECETNGRKHHVSKLPIWINFEFINHQTGYTITDMTFNT